ncbi:MAG: hypothetical protein GXO26_02900 [Crenarchaeota archaeon]|nr:hypothetical protein [Thermoproteota archaeon]
MLKNRIAPHLADLVRELDLLISSLERDDSAENVYELACKLAEGIDTLYAKFDNYFLLNLSEEEKKILDEVLNILSDLAQILESDIRLIETGRTVENSELVREGLEKLKSIRDLRSMLVKVLENL